MRKLFLYLTICMISALNLHTAPGFKLLDLTGEDDYHWGDKYPQESILNHKFRLVNTGQDTLNILDLHPGCSCVSASINNYNIAPNDTAILSASLNTIGYKGYIQKLVTIKSNDPNTSEFYLLLKANIIYPVTFSPNEYFFFPALELNKSQTSTIEITNTTDSTITILDINISTADVKINLNPKDTIAAKSSIKLNATVMPSENKPFFATISFRTDCKQDPVFRVFVKGNIKK